MSMDSNILIDSKYLGVFFFIRRHKAGGDEHNSFLTYLGAAGAYHISQRPEPIAYLPHTTTQHIVGAATCHWAGIQCEAELDRLENHYLLNIYFLQSHFFEMIGDKRTPLPLEEDGALGLAYAFRDACENLSPEVAFVAPHTYKAHPESVRKCERMILARDADALADERLGLLYLNDEISQYWTPDKIRDDRDSLPISRGKLVFAGRDWSRWF